MGKGGRTGTPFISGLELRPLKNSLYPQVNAMRWLNKLNRVNFGPTDATYIVSAKNNAMVRYPDDPYDRKWFPMMIDANNWAVISTEKTVQNSNNDKFEPPSKVMQMAATPLNASNNIQFQMYSNKSLNLVLGAIVILYFSELEPPLGKAMRQFYININNKMWYPQGYTPPYLYSDAVFNTFRHRGYTKYNVTISATANSTLPPIIGTDSQDGITLVVVSVVVLFFLLRRKRKGWVNNSVKPRNETSMSHVRPTDDGHSSLRLENRRFTYKELERITNNFQHVIGRGGFGHVYDGFLEDGTQVAVKLRSESSNQGVKEFLTEAQILTRIHHKNLVSMIGYCKDGEYMALVYEYMSEGTLQEHTAGKRLTWRQRLRIALESAQGLEYLHKGCNPPLIHRDVKTTNILLNAKLEAKVADFGLSRAFNYGIYTHVSTNTLVGTPVASTPAAKAI
ncbi:hypothetical protein EJB05_35832, partial [Eragrostis curvula]